MIFMNKTGRKTPDISPWVRTHAPRIKPGGSVLDLACGGGRHALWLANQGWVVDAVDRDGAALHGMAEMAHIRSLCADLEAGPWPYSGRQFDGIVVSRYLHRPLLGKLHESLAPGGVLIYETFMAGNERHGKPSNPDFLLRPDELLTEFAPWLTVIAFEQGEQSLPTPAVMQRICAIKEPS